MVLDLFSNFTYFLDDPEHGDQFEQKDRSVHDLPGPWRNWTASARVRHFGPRDLIEDGSVRSDSTTLVNAQAGYKFNERWGTSVEVFNSFDSKVSDIDYFHTSRLRGEPDEGVDDIHFHPAEPHQLRVSVTAKFRSPSN